MTIRVAIFEDNLKYRNSLEILINGSTGFSVAGTFDDASDVIDKIASVNPDIILMDIEMPVSDGISALQKIKKRYPKLNVLMQTVFEDDDKIFESICNGASGYILKNTPPTKILDYITETYQGGAPMSPVVAKKVLQLLTLQKQFAVKPSETFDLTPREKEILAQMVNGLSYKMIAAKLDIGFETVRSHISSIYKKLHVATMTEAVAKAIKSNLV